MFCPNCGFELDGDLRYCTECGYALEDAKAVLNSVSNEVAEEPSVINGGREEISLATKRRRSLSPRVQEAGEGESRPWRASP